MAKLTISRGVEEIDDDNIDTGITIGRLDVEGVDEAGNPAVVPNEAVQVSLQFGAQSMTVCAQDYWDPKQMAALRELIVAIRAGVLTRVMGAKRS